MTPTMTRPSPSRTWLLAVLLALLLPRLARADGQPRYIEHRVKPGDTLLLLAAEYYGDRDHAVFIMVANHMDHPRPLKPGETIKIPVGRDVTTAAGDTFKSLAAANLGDERRAEFLAKYNGRSVDSSIAAGEEIHIPLRVTHTAAAKVTLSDLAATYLGDRKQAGFLKSYNFLDHDVLEKGETIIIPIQQVRVRQSKMPAPDVESAARSAKRREMLGLAQRLLPAARAAWRDGDYAAIREGLSRIDTDYLDREHATEIGLLLGSTYIAFNDTPSAIATFKKVLERWPDEKINRFDQSPKICAAWQQAGGQVDDNPR